MSSDEVAELLIQAWKEEDAQEFLRLVNLLMYVVAQEKHLAF